MEIMVEFERAEWPRQIIGGSISGCFHLIFQCFARAGYVRLIEHGNTQEEVTKKRNLKKKKTLSNC
jgi:organic hydroperoxide reductase OsmC/OhrA